MILIADYKKNKTADGARAGRIEKVIDMLLNDRNRRRWPTVSEKHLSEAAGLPFLGRLKDVKRYQTPKNKDWVACNYSDSDDQKDFDSDPSQALMKIIAKGGPLPANLTPYLPKLNEQAWPTARTALTCAAEKGNLGAVKILLDKGADPNVVDANGHTPLDIAIHYNKLDIVKEFLKARPAPAVAMNVNKSTGTPGKRPKDDYLPLVRATALLLQEPTTPGRLDVFKALVDYKTPKAGGGFDESRTTSFKDANVLPGLVEAYKAVSASGTKGIIAEALRALTADPAHPPPATEELAKDLLDSDPLKRILLTAAMDWKRLNPPPSVPSAPPRR